MSTNDTQGCPRCRDYDEIKNDLERQRERSQDHQRTALSDCETARTNLQRKLTRVGIAAVIGGTVMGKEFVDKIASYIESFNQVVNVAPNLVGSNINSIGGGAGGGSSSGAGSTPKKEQKEEEDKEEEEKKADTPKRPFSPYTNKNPYPIFASMDPEPVEPLEKILNDAIAAENDQILSQLSFDFSDFDNRNIDLLTNQFAMDYRIAEVPNYSSVSIPRSSTIPAPGSLAFLLLPLLFRNRRRR